MAFIERKVIEVEWNESNVRLQIEGWLWQVEEVQYSDGVGLVYTVKSEEKIFRFRGSKQLNTNLNKSDVGKKVRIRYDGEDKSKPLSNGMHYPKKFTVAVDEDSANPTMMHYSKKFTVAVDEDSANPTITDSDIPF